MKAVAMLVCLGLGYLSEDALVYWVMVLVTVGLLDGTHEEKRGRARAGGIASPPLIVFFEIGSSPTKSR